MALCLLATFPYEALHARVLAEVSRRTGMEVRVAEWAVGVPLGLEWRNVTFSKPNADPVQVAFVQANLGAFRALTGGLNLDLSVHLDQATPTPARPKRWWRPRHIPYAVR